MYVVFFHAAPFLKASNLRKAKKIINNKNENYVVHAITKYSHPPERSLLVNKGNKITLVNEKLMHKMTQSFQKNIMMLVSSTCQIKILGLKNLKISQE